VLFRSHLFATFGMICLISFNLFCNKEHSCENCTPVIYDTLPANYPFAWGLCNGVFLDSNSSSAQKYIPLNSDNLPDSFSLDMPQAGDQQGQKSCSAWAVTYAAGSYYMHSHLNMSYSDTNNISPSYTYNQIAKGNCECTSIVDHLFILSTQGACSLGSMPYDPNNCSLQPDSLQKSKAANYKIQGYKIVDLTNIDSVKRVLYEKNPIIIAIPADDNFKYIRYPYIWKSLTGTGNSHAVVITGYDNSRNAFKILNSFSTHWGDKGYIWMDYGLFAKIPSVIKSTFGGPGSWFGWVMY
jgi:C1A family cysteine protease